MSKNNLDSMNDKRPEISIAPMMDWTDRHYRYFMRFITPHTKLYTEMITCGALIHGDTDRFLRFDECEHPIALQLGGSEAKDMTHCAKLGEDAGYDEININCGCPSDRVQSGRFGACLMAEPERVAECVNQMQNAVDVPVTVKCRIGIDKQDSAEFLETFIRLNADAGCKTVIIHARKAWLKGLSPKENRTVPEINYQRVYDMKTAFPDLNIIINGEIKTVEDIRTHIQNNMDGAMLGREAYQNPYVMAEIERKIFGNHDIKGRVKIAKAMIPYIEQQQKDYDVPIKSITRHMINLFHHQKGAKAWRRALSILPYEEGATAENVIERALSSF